MEIGLGISDKKNNSTEDGIDGTNDHFQRNSGCSAEQKPLGIPFRTLPLKRKQLGIPLNSVPWNKNRSILLEFGSEPFRGRETSRNSVPWNKTRNKLSEFRSEPFRGRETTRNSVSRQDTIKKTGLGEWNKLIYDCYVIIYSSLRTV